MCVYSRRLSLAVMSNIGSVPHVQEAKKWLISNIHDQGHWSPALKMASICIQGSWLPALTMVSTSSKGHGHLP